LERPIDGQYAFALLMLLTLALIIVASKLSPSLLGTDEENA